MDPDEKYQMNEDARGDIVENPWPPFYIPQENECPSCGSCNTFVTFDKKLVCRSCWKVTNH